MCNSKVPLLLSVLCCFLFFQRLADRDLWSSHEGRAAQDAQTLLNEGVWSLPRLFDRQVDLQKPPLYYWLVACLAWLRGGQVDAWAVRLPAALSALGCVLGFWFFGLWRQRRTAGWIAALILATAIHFTWMARIGRIDMPLTLVVGATLLCFYQGHSRKRDPAGRGSWTWFLSGYSCLVPALLLKGPIGVVLPASAIGLYLLLEGELPLPWRMRSWLRLAHRFGLWWGMPLVVVLAGPWFWWANVQTEGAFFRTFFWYHNFERAFGDVGGHWSNPWWFYGPRLAVDFLPWSPLLPVAGWFLYRNRAWRQDAEARFGLAWLVAMVGVLSCAGFKRADYLLPAYPGAALFLGCAGERWYRGLRFPRRVALAFGLMIAGCAGGWAVQMDYLLPQQEVERDYRQFAEEIRRLAPAPQTIVFFRAESHPLAFHLGGPLLTLVEWNDLNALAARPEPVYIIMKPDSDPEVARFLRLGRFDEVLHNTDLAGGRHEHPLLLLRTRPGTGPAYP